jgi:hypothetical protein
MPVDVRFVISSGAGGGLVSWAFTLITGATFGLGPLAALPLCVILGAAAAMVAVYVVTPVDVSKTGKLIAFSLLCGFLWKPVLDAGRDRITERLQVAQTDNAADSQVEALKSASPQTVAAKADEAAGSAAELLRSSDRLDNPIVERQATERATEAVDAIAETSTANPAAARDALDEIRDAARESGNELLVGLITQKLKRIPKQPPEAPPVSSP